MDRETGTARSRRATGSSGRAVNSRPAEQGALAAGGLAAVILGLGVRPGIAALIVLVVGAVPGAITRVVNAGGLRGLGRQLWRGR